MKFESEATDAINYLSKYIEENDLNERCDVDFVADGLDITTTKGVYTIRKQSVVSELWITSPISGPYHFAYKNNEWINKDNIKLFDLLISECLLY